VKKQIRKLTLNPYCSDLKKTTGNQVISMNQTAFAKNNDQNLQTDPDGKLPVMPRTQ